MTNQTSIGTLPLSAANGGLGVASPTAHGILVAEGSSPAVTKVLTNGQVLIGSTGNDPVAATLGSGTNITVTTGSGTASIAVSGQIAIANGGTGQATNTLGFNALSPLTTKGDIVVRDATNNIRLPVGTNGFILSADSGQTSGLNWIANAAAGGLLNVQVFTASGTYTPTSGTTKALVYVIGGGAGGGAGNAGNSGSGGGAGGAAILWQTASVVTQTITVGASVAAATGGNTSSYGALASATGGTAGSTNAGGSAGGLGSSGTINIRGGGSGAVANNVQGGTGGNSIYGGGGSAGGGGTGGGNGGNYGGGGGGGGSGGTTAGGTGAAGIVIIYEYS